MTKRRKFRLMQKALKVKYRNFQQNEIILRDHDFIDGRLTKVGYLSLKHQADYISLGDDIDIKVPSVYAHDFKNSFEYLAAKELMRIRSDIKSSSIVALVLFVVGLLLFVIKEVAGIQKIDIINEVFLIASWVFIWSSVEKMFFEQRKYRNDRVNIFHLLAANIKPY